MLLNPYNFELSSLGFVLFLICQCTQWSHTLTGIHKFPHNFPVFITLTFSTITMDSKLTVADNEVCIEPIVQIAKDAGDAILEIYDTPTEEWGVATKSDDSPLTKADLAANEVICSKLSTLFPSIPIMSEETKADDYETRLQWKYYWCVDPLDGTKEFVKRNGEFTVNIALMQNTEQGASSILGVVYAPVLKTCYFGVKGFGSFIEKDNEINSMKVKEYSQSDSGLIVVCSRSHLDEQTQKFIDKFDNPSKKSMGSSLKFMLIANGDAHVYPRLAPTMEWDTAASQIIVEEAGGQVLNADTMKPLMYNKQELRNPFFFVFGKQTS